MIRVPRVELAPGFTVSRVITGLWQIADMERSGEKLDPDATAAAMAPYVEAGFTTFDMADHYGTAEIIAGRFSKLNGRGVELLTKWVPKPGSNSREQVRAAVQRSLDRMQTDHLTLLQFHAWNYADPSWLDCLFWLEELREEGLIRHLGVTNFDTAHLAMVLHTGIEIVSNQVSFSLLDQRAKRRMTALCAEHGVPLLVFGTVAGGLLTERWVGAPAPDVDRLGTWPEMKYRRFIEAAGGWERFQNLVSTIERVAQRRGVSMANVAARCMLDEPAVGSVIIGARLGASDHLADNRGVFDLSLDGRDQREIAAALALLEPIPGDCGDEYRKPPFLTASGDLSHHVDSMPPAYEVRVGADGRSRVLTGTVWENLAGFSRAVRHGNRIVVSGTTATHGSRTIGGSDPGGQLHFVIDKIEGAIQSLGGRLEDVIRTRIYVNNTADWEPIARVHGERFRHILPANTLILASIVGDEYLVEMEAEAIVD